MRVHNVLSMTIMIGTHPSSAADFSLYEDDIASIRRLPLHDIHKWCDRRTQEYKAYIAFLHSLRNSLPGNSDDNSAVVTVSDMILPHGILGDDVEEIVAMEPLDAGWWCKTKIEHYRARIRGLRTLRNTAAPINTLPQELLAEIFIHALYIHRRRDGPVVRRVCRIWRQVADHTPQFWSNLPPVGLRPDDLPHSLMLGRDYLPH